jgi:hypothetical protein
MNKLYKNSLVSVVLWLMGVTLSFAQTIVTGTVLAEDNKEPLPGVSILVKGQSKGWSSRLSDIQARKSRWEIEPVWM